MTANGYVTADRGWYEPPCFDRPLILALTLYPAFQGGRDNGAIIKESTSFDLDGAEILTMR